MIKLLFLPVRLIMKPILLAMEHTLRPAPIQRPAERQAEVDAETKGLTLYQFRACPFCIKVRRNIRRLNLDIEKRNANENPQYQEELIDGGGRWQTPCLRIEKDGKYEWLYESSDIIDYLNNKYAA
ncbi:MAG: glutathione S-transferase N-terminal domain-containing protein [Gammaproteobacteria bacterium]|nr:glutathione S-transferase N-terminal domain-containing protein [Gammaproteobacteria bacterium]MCW8982967.1 glutathione S-transferase N-terminal domain-containing protein [Gammaproteobacteria bacterium]